MKLTKKLCEQVGIINAWDYSKKNTVPMLTYITQETGRMYHPASWHINLKGYSYSERWDDYGAMTFDVYHREDKQKQFNAAIAWMKAQYGYDEIVKTPIGSWMEKSFVEKRNQEIIDALKQGISLRET